METTTSILVGQWTGHFKYGEAFGKLRGQEVSFRIILKEASDKLFHGKCIELEGVGLNPQIAEIRGFLEGDRISFVKEYPINYVLDEEGGLILDNIASPPLLTYFGEYNEQTKTFAGHWELEVDSGNLIEDSLTVFTGTWKMSKL